MKCPPTVEANGQAEVNIIDNKDTDDDAMGFIHLCSPGGSARGAKPCGFSQRCIQPHLKYERLNPQGHYPQGPSSLSNHEPGFRLCRPSLLPNPRDCSNRWRRWRARACRSMLRSVSSTISPVRTSKTSSKVTTPETPPYSSTTTARCSWAL